MDGPDKRPGEGAQHTQGPGRIQRRGAGQPAPSSASPPTPAEPPAAPASLAPLQQLLDGPEGPGAESDLEALLDKLPHPTAPQPTQAAPQTDNTPAGTAGANTAPAGPPQPASLAPLHTLLAEEAGTPASSPAPAEPPAPKARGKKRTARQKKQRAAAAQAAPPPKPPRRTKAKKGDGDPGTPKEKRGLRKLLTPKRVLLTLCALFVLVVVSLGFFFVYTTRNDDLWLDLDTMPYRTETILYYTSADGTVHDYTVIPCTQHKEYVPGEEIPQMLRDAFVAVEDKDFYSHHGFSPSRTLFAVFNEAVYTLTGSYPGGVRQGASTIDQQLIKNLTRDDEDSNMAGYFRKLREICRAIRLDALYDKDEILNAYLNTISFTGNTAGVQAEAKKLFGKPVNQLSLAECASLACITRSPARYNPVTNPENHIERRNYVLGLMLEQGYITAAQHDEAVATPLQLNYTGEVRAPEYTTSWFTDLVIDEVIREFTQQNGLSRQEAINLFYNGGLRIYTTIDPTLQAAMEAELAGGGAYPALWATVQKPLLDDAGNVRTDEAGNTLYGPETVTPQAAMVSLAYDGAVRAVVGGLGEKTVSRGLNRATAAARQPGSTIKPIAPYVTALEAGLIHWSSPFLDDPVGTVTNAQGEEVDWPANASGGYSGRDVLVRDGLSRSLNTTAVRVGQLAGQRRMYNFLTKDLNFSTLVPQDNSLAPLTLGALTYGATPLEMAAAYAMFGNGGYSVTPHSFTHITGGTGLVMLEQDAPMERVIGEETAFVMNRLLCEVVQNGTAAGMAVPGGMESAGKTGTTTNRRDHWFVGLTPYYVTASWYGYDEQLPLEVPGTGHPPTLAWRSVMQRAQASLPQLSFPVAEKAQQHQYCTQSGAMAGPSCPAATGWYQPGNLPQKTCPLHS